MSQSATSPTRRQRKNWPCIRACLHSIAVRTRHCGGRGNPQVQQQPTAGGAVSRWHRVWSEAAPKALRRWAQQSLNAGR
eukprot:7346822-Alexandrium_andersonii.AAC.1